MRRYFITGTDTDVGKTRVTAMVGLALRLAGEKPTIVKLVQTGLEAGDTGDAARAGELAGVSWREFARFAKPADPWSAARAQGAPPLRAADLAEALQPIRGSLVVEGTGGLMVPLNAEECMAGVAAAAGLSAIVVVGMRLGCINHALLTVDSCVQLGLPLAAGILVERWGPTGQSYQADVTRALQGKLRILGIVPFATDEASSVQAGAKLFESLTR